MIQTEFEMFRMMMFSCCLLALGFPCFAQQSDAPAPSYSNVKYGPHEKNTLDFWQADSDKPASLVIFIHGGGFVRGDKATNPKALGIKGPGFRHNILNALKEAGFAVASVNYRLPENPDDPRDDVFRPLQIRDVKAAIRYLRANADMYHIDADQIGLCGLSAGAGLANLAGVSGNHTVLDDYGSNQNHSSGVQAVVSFYAPTFYRMRGVTNVLQYVTVGDAAFLLVHGEKDKTVPIENSFAFRDALVKAGYQAGTNIIFEEVAGAGHGLGKRFNDFIPVSIKFLKQQLVIKK